MKKDFYYEKPTKYNIEFAAPAVYASGCLTCGIENAVVENYGERYCCSTCQKTLQTPDGLQVKLSSSIDGRRIRGQAIKYGRVANDIKVNVCDLRIRGGHKCHATFAGEKGDVIVLLDEVDENYVYS